jgi:hypothetical protein
VQLFCASNQLTKDWFDRAVREATEIEIENRKTDGLDGKSIDPAYVRSLVLETVLTLAAVAGRA